MNVYILLDRSGSMQFSDEVKTSLGNVK